MSEPCGACRIIPGYTKLGEGLIPPEIKFCPLHAAAQELLDRFSETHLFHALHNEPESKECSDCILITAARRAEK